MIPSTWLPYRFLSFSLCNTPGLQSPLYGRFSFSLFFVLSIIVRSGLLSRISWSVCISESQRSLCVSFYRTDSSLSIYYLIVWPNFNFLQNSRWIPFHIQLSLVSYSLCASLQHLLIIRLIVTSLSPHNLHFLFCCVISIFAFI